MTLEEQAQRYCTALHLRDNGGEMISGALARLYPEPVGGIDMDAVGQKLAHSLKIVFAQHYNSPIASEPEVFLVNTLIRKVKDEAIRKGKHHPTPLDELQDEAKRYIRAELRKAVDETRLPPEKLQNLIARQQMRCIAEDLGKTISAAEKKLAGYPFYLRDDTPGAREFIDSAPLHAHGMEGATVKEARDWAGYVGGVMGGFADAVDAPPSPKSRG